jgi:hypothetical protein
MADSGGGTRWVKYGCFGCAGLALFVVAALGGLFAIGFMTTKDPVMEERTLTHDVTPAAIGAGADGDATQDLAVLTPSARGAGRVTLDVSNVEVKMFAGDPGDPLRVEASFDSKTFEMEESFETPEGQPWHYTFRFKRKGSSGMSLLKRLFYTGDPEVSIYLPPDSPIVLDVEASEGAFSVELGGLWLTEADLDVSMGALVVEVDDPMREPMERLNINVSMGGAQFENLGNTSARELIVDFSMGGMELDLSGEWRNDSDITVSMSSGGGAMQLPKNVTI